MASVQLYRFEFIQNNPYGTFVTGDVLDVFLETTSAVVPAVPLGFQSAGITVNLNGVSYPSSGAGFILDFNPSIINVQNFNPQICIGTSLLAFSLSAFWPYVYYYSQENHYSCTVNPPTCNLSIVGLPIVVPASDTSASDGSIQIIATSTNSIQMRMGSDFVYDDGTGQIESIFSGLLPGQYRIFIRDSANCGVNILVDVPVNNTFGTKYRLEYTDYEGYPTRVDITMRGYSGPIIQDKSIVKGSDLPIEISLRGEGSIDKFTALMSSQGNVNLTSVTDSQYLELYTNDPNLYRIEYSKDFGNMIPGEPGFTPASLPTLDLWVNEDTGGPAWTISATPSVDFDGLGLNQTSDRLYTDYAFDAGREYTFNYTLTMPSICATAKIKLFDASKNELLNTNIVIPTTTTSGQYLVTAPAGAAGIGIHLNSPCSCGAATPGFCTKTLTAFTNATPSVPSAPETPVGYELLWIGKILPMQYTEEYKAPPYYVNVVATDGLAELNTFFLIQPDGSKYYGTISLVKLVAHCLSYLNLDLDIRIACNLYAVNMNQEDANDPFDQAYVDFEAFYLAEKEPTLAFVLQSVLEAFGCRITQWELRWNIERVEEKVAEYDFRQFDHEGNYLFNGSFDPVIDIEYPEDSPEGEDALLVDNDHNLEIKPGYGRIKAIYSLGLKPNILNNGDFRLKSTYIPSENVYAFTLNKDNWTLVNAGYTLTESYEFLDENNIAYIISSGEDTLTGTNGGEAYVQSDIYSVKMGTNNQLKITVRCKVSRQSVLFAGSVFTVDVPYVKIRFRVKYGSLYLQADGSWTSTENILTFYTTEFNKYAEYEITANQPATGTPVSGMDFDIRVYHAYAYHADFFSIADLKAFETWDGSQQVIPTGYKTEIRDSGGLYFGTMYYYELEESTEADDGFNVIDPNDSNVSNERRWILKTKKIGSGGVSGTNVFPMAIDKVQVEYLTDGQAPIDTIVRTVKGETNNPFTFEKPLVIGSYSNLIVTDVSLGIDLGVFFPSGGLAITTTNTLSADLIYTGYLRDSEGNGYEFFARDGVGESDKLHGILLKQYALQYRRSWRLLRGSIYAKQYFGLLNVGRLVNDNNRIYLPIGLSLNDKRRTLSGEFLELTNINGDEGGASPFSSGFTVGFGASGFH
jgi:hypothetical protein